jgi:hypothetical protein
MSSKAYIFKQIRDILQDKFDKSEEEIEAIIEEKKNNRAYELLVYKKQLKETVLDDDKEEMEDVSISTRLKN